MNKKIFSITLLLILSLPVYAVDCYRKPCHKKCIDTQPQNVKTQCWCNSRKKVYYHHWGASYGVPEYNEVCDGDFAQYAIKYCAAKHRYDNAYLMNPTTAYTYTPQYDQICDGSYEMYTQNIQQLKQNQALNNMADAIRQPVQVNVRHSGTINQNVQLNGTIRYMNYWY